MAKTLAWGDLDVGSHREFAHILQQRGTSGIHTQEEPKPNMKSNQDDESTPLGKILAAYAELIKQGKVGDIGASNYSAARLSKH
jgi:diketogulonate reductase-like aldo/keto reductase